MDLSVTIPTHTEANHIGQLIDQLHMRERHWFTEILAGDAGSKDGTATLAAEAGATVLLSPKTGRAAQMNDGAQYDRGDALYFVHAEVGIHPDFLTDITQAVNQEYDVGCYRFQFDSSHPMLRLNRYNTRLPGLMSRGIATTYKAMLRCR